MTTATSTLTGVGKYTCVRSVVFFCSCLVLSFFCSLISKTYDIDTKLHQFQENPSFSLARSLLNIIAPTIPWDWTYFSKYSLGKKIITPVPEIFINLDLSRFQEDHAIKLLYFIVSRVSCITKPFKGGAVVFQAAAFFNQTYSLLERPLPQNTLFRRHFFQLIIIPND